MNFQVVCAYFLFLISTLISVLTLRYIPLSFSSALEATGYIYVAVLSNLILKEKLTKRQIVGMCIIIVGVIIYSLGL